MWKRNRGRLVDVLYALVALFIVAAVLTLREVIHPLIGIIVIVGLAGWIATIATDLKFGQLYNCLYVGSGR